MRAFVTFHTTTLEADLKKSALESKTQDLRIFSLNSNLLGFPPNANAIGNFYYANWPGLFDEIVVGPSVRLFDDSWSRAFLRHCCRNLRQDGVLHVSCKPAARAQESGGWSDRELAAFLKPQSLRVSGAVATLQSPNPSAAVESTLDWFTGTATALAVQEILFRNNNNAAEFDLSDSLGARMLYEGETSPAPYEGSGDGTPLWMKNTGPITLEAELEKTLPAQSYYVGGIAYKGPLLKFLLRHHGLTSRKLSAIDFGGGYGLLMAELLLDPATNVQRAIVRDILVENKLLATQLFRSLYASVRDRFFFSLGPAETFEFRERFDIISFVGSLLYVPLNERLPTLERCWGALNPGGALIVHENIKAPSYVRDYDVMFTVEEIDSLLGKFGKIHRYASTEIRPLTASEAAAKSVFRLVQKPI